MSKMKFVCAIYSNEKKYFISSMIRKKTTGRYDKFKKFYLIFFSPSTNNVNPFNSFFAWRGECEDEPTPSR